MAFPVLKSIQFIHLHRHIGNLKMPPFSFPQAFMSSSITSTKLKTLRTPEIEKLFSR